jgi:hypothetical protein
MGGRDRDGVGGGAGDWGGRLGMGPERGDAARLLAIAYSLA